MLIDVHAHLFTAGMLNRHTFRGPFMKARGLTVGHFSLGTSKLRPPAASDAEAEALGAKGLCVGGANFNGLEAHSEALFPVWEKLASLYVPIMVHGYNQSISLGEAHHADKFETSSIVGDCVDETLFFWYLICGGALDAFAGLNTYITHAGGMAVFQLGRLSELNHAMAPDARNRRKLMDYLPDFWFDLDVHSPALRRGVVEAVGVDRLLHGTNFGGAYDNGDPTAGLGLDDPARDKIRSGNATALLRLAA